jgi:hypothetical protein
MTQGETARLGTPVWDTIAELCHVGETRLDPVAPNVPSYGKPHMSPQATRGMTGV